MACTENSSSWGFCRFFSILNVGGSPGANLLKRATTDFVGSIWRNTTLFPVILIFSRFPLFSQPVLIPNGQRKGGVLNALQCFASFVKISPCGKFKKIKTNKAVLTIVIGLKWRRQCHPTPVLLPGKSHGRRSLVGCSPWVS